jgi:hypothetical protein
MNTPSPVIPEGSDRIVYVRSVATADLPSEIRHFAGTADRVYAVHTSEGERLALVPDRRLAFMLARQHDFSPVSVH